MKHFIVKYDRKYLSKSPSWNGAGFTVDPNYAIVYTEADYEHFKKFYPQMELIEADEYQVNFQERRSKMRLAKRLDRNSSPFLKDDDNV